MPSQLQADVAEGEKLYMTTADESWEAKTWRQVVKLREAMLQTRLGISTGEAE
jgi:hypothetical protein